MLLGALACTACRDGAEQDAAHKPPRLVEVGAGDAARPEDALVIVLHDLAAILESHQAQIEPGLQALREYIVNHRQAVRDSVQAIEQTSQGLSGPARSEYVDEHEAEVRSAMERFARAQQAFRAAATEAQRVELSEILNSLE